jgi:hypothetical protein
MHVSHHRLSLFTAACALLSASIWACSDDAPANNPGGEVDGGSPNAPETSSDPDGGDDPTVPPLYAVVSLPPAAGAAEQTSYVIVSESLTGTLDPASAQIEVEGSAVAGGPVRGGTLFVGSSKSSTVTRYSLDTSGKLQPSGTVDFAAQGLTSLAGYSSGFEFISPNKAYWLSREGKAIVFDPTELTVTGSIDLSGLVRQDPENPGTNYTMSFSGTPAHRIGSKLYTFAAWDSRAAGTIKVPPVYAVVILDSATDTAQVVVDEAGCGYGRDAVLDGDWLYVATEAVGASVHHLNPNNGPESCLRRFNVATGTFDASYNVKLDALAGGAPVGSLAVSPDGTPLIHVLDTTAPQAGSLTNPRQLSSAAIWKTAKLTVGDAPTLELLNVPLKSASVLPAPLGAGFTVTPTFDTTDTVNPRIFEVTSQGIVATERASATITGTTWGIVRLR